MAPRTPTKAVQTAPGSKVVRVAVYTRKSTSAGLEQDFQQADAVGGTAGPREGQHQVVGGHERVR